MTTTKLLLTNIKLNGQTSLVDNFMYVPSYCELVSIYADHRTDWQEADVIAGYIMAMMIPHGPGFTYDIVCETTLPVLKNNSDWLWDLAEVVPDESHAAIGWVKYNMSWDNTLVIEVPTDLKELADYGGYDLAIESSLWHTINVIVEHDRIK